MDNKQKKVFIDGGAHWGESVAAFASKYMTHPTEYEIYSFEANPNLVPNIQENFNRIANQFPGISINFYNAALSTTEGLCKFYIADSHYASTTRSDKTTGGVNVNSASECVSIDTDSFIKQFNKDDYIILKLDIEGGEYDVLPHLIRGGSMSYINELLIEWHHHKLDRIDEEYHNILLNAIEQIYNITPKYWSAMEEGGFTLKRI